MNELTSFRAFNCSGAIIPDPGSVTALSILFDKIYLPNDLEIVADFARNFRINNEPKGEIKIVAQEDGQDDPFHDLTDLQRQTAYRYLSQVMEFSMQYAPLFHEGVFEAPFFSDGQPLHAELVREGGSGELNTYEVSQKSSMQFRSEASDVTAALLESGYVPVVGKFSPSGTLDGITSTQIASLLAMNAARLVLPRTKAASPHTILEAREKLKDQLPPFWAAMLKLTRELRKGITEGMSPDQLQQEAKHTTDEIVLPALLDLKHKLMLERKNWFFRILSPVQKGLRLLVGNPPLTQQQLITNAMVLGSDVAMAGASHFQQIDALKNSSGLTMLLDMEQLLDDDAT